ncbi:MAG: lipopolysaccharide biosynthesis protein [Gaiellaceae bacterium]
MPLRSDLERKLLHSSAWNALSYGGTQILTFGLMIVLARLLTPADFGLVTLASLPLLALGYLQESGLGAAVIKRRADVERAAATQLVFAALSSLVLYVASFAAAPLLARVFSQPALTSVFRVLALTLVVRGAMAVPATLLERDLAFDKRARGDVAGILTQTVVSIACAAGGLGVWSLVAGQVANVAVQAAVYWMLTPLRPSPRLASWSMLRELGRYGRHITASNVLLLVNDNADNAVIGRLLGASSVGVYNLAWRLSNLPATQVSFIISRVTFAVYAELQDDLDQFRAVFLTTLRRIAFLSIPLALGILIAAKPIVVAIFGETWKPAVVPLQVLAIFGMSRTFAGVTSAVFQASGRPQLNYQLGLWHSAVLFSSLYLLARRFGVEGVAWAEVAASVSTMIPCYFFATRILELPLRELLGELAMPAFCSLTVAGSLLATRVAVTPLDPAVQLVVLVAIGLGAYGAAMLTFGRHELSTIVRTFTARRPATEP